MGRAEHAVAMCAQLSPVWLDEPVIGALVARFSAVKELLLVHSLRSLSPRLLGCQSASSPLSGVVTTLRQPAGPSRGPSSTDAPSFRAQCVAASTRSTSTYGSHSARRVPHSTIPPPIPSAT